MIIVMKLKEKLCEERLCEEIGSYQIRDVIVVFLIVWELKFVEIYRFGYENQRLFCGCEGVGKNYSDERNWCKEIKKGFVFG